MNVVNRLLNTRKIKSHSFPIILFGLIFIFLWILVFFTSKTPNDPGKFSLGTVENVQSSEPDEIVIDDEVVIDDEIVIDDEVVAVDTENKLTDNIFQDIISKISSMGPKVSLPFSQTFSETDTTVDLKDDSLGYYIKKCPNIGNNPEDWVDTLSYNTLKDSYLIVNDNVKEEISSAHKGFIEHLKGNWEYPSTFYEGSGIVIGGGGKYSLQAYAVISAIRELKTTLPIEVLIPSSLEQDKPFCEMLNTKFDDVKCIFLQDIFEDQFLKTHKFHAFQYKSLALMASSFQNVLLLDADDFPVRNINDIFDNDIFEENGMIVWPDFWRRTTHPYFYESAGIDIDFNKRLRNFYENIDEINETADEGKDSKLPYHDFEGALPDPSSETGEFLIDKKRHWKSLILSLYYNVHGPNVFYHLFSQYAAGQGDKETFLAAAHILELPYYQVYLKPSLDAYFEPKEDARRSVAYYQKDYRKDYQYRFIDNEKNLNDFLNHKHTESDSLFAHCNLPKFDVIQMADKNDFTYVKDDEHFRAMTCKDCLKEVDLEKIVTVAYYEEVCKEDQSENVFKYLVHKNHDKICKYWKKRYDLVLNTVIAD